MTPWVSGSAATIQWPVAQTAARSPRPSTPLAELMRGTLEYQYEEGRIGFCLTLPGHADTPASG